MAQDELFDGDRNCTMCGWMIGVRSAWGTDHREKYHHSIGLCNVCYAGWGGETGRQVHAIPFPCLFYEGNLDNV
jgi:hypothetical protein